MLNVLFVINCCVGVILGRGQKTISNIWAENKINKKIKSRIFQEKKLFLTPYITMEILGHMDEKN